MIFATRLFLLHESTKDEKDEFTTPINFRSQAAFEVFNRSVGDVIFLEWAGKSFA